MNIEEIPHDQEYDSITLMIFVDGSSCKMKLSNNRNNNGFLFIFKSTIPYFQKEIV